MGEIGDLRTFDWDVGTPRNRQEELEHGLEADRHKADLGQVGRNLGARAARRTRCRHPDLLKEPELPATVLVCAAAWAAAVTFFNALIERD
jgi:hypothetical protein